MRLVHDSDLEKIGDVLEAAYEHHLARDQSNARLHLARDTRLSPLTSQLGAERDRLTAILQGPTEPNSGSG